MFHTFTEADLVLRERAAEVDGDLSRQLYASAASTQAPPVDMISMIKVLRHVVTYGQGCFPTSDVRIR